MPGPESETVTDQQSASALPVTSNRAPLGRVLDGVRDEIAENLLAKRGVGDHDGLGGVGAHFPVELRARARPGQTGGRSRAISAPIVNEPRQIGPRALDDARVVEVSAREAQKLVTQGDHGGEMPALVLGDRRRRLVEQQVEAGPKRDQRTAELVAQIRQNRPQLSLVDRETRDSPGPRLPERLGWIGLPWTCSSLHSSLNLRICPRSHRLANDHSPVRGLIYETTI